MSAVSDIEWVRGLTEAEWSYVRQAVEAEWPDPITEKRMWCAELVRGMSQTAAAAKVGVSPTTASGYLARARGLVEKVGAKWRWGSRPLPIPMPAVGTLLRSQRVTVDGDAQLHRELRAVAKRLGMSIDDLVLGFGPALRNEVLRRLPFMRWAHAQGEDA